MKNRDALSLEDVQRASFSTSTGADELCDDFARRRLGLPARNYAARLAMARSLSVPSAPAAVEDTARRSIKGAALFGDDAATWVTLFVEHGPSESMTLTDLQDLVRRHWARGMKLLEEDWTAVEEDHDRFILRLAQFAGLKSSGDSGPGPGPDRGPVFTPRAVPVRLPLGPVSRRVDNDEAVTFPVNGAGNSPHIAIMGSLGTGKTRVARTMMAEAHRQSGCPVIVFDPKGDLSEDKAFVESIGATVVSLPKMPVPLDILHAGTGTKEARAAMSMRFRESFARVPSGRLGDVQTALVGEAVDLALSGRSPVTLSQVQDRVKELYAARKRKDDIVTTTFADMTRLTLFDPKMPPAEFFSRSWVIDLHNQFLSDSARRLVSFLIFDAAAMYLLSQPDSDVDADYNRALRLMLVVDEARKVLEYEQESFIDLIRAGRSKGGVVMTISQSPDDFVGQNENFLENIGLGVVLKTNAKANTVAAMLGASPDLSGLENGVCYTRLGQEPATRVRTWA